MKQYGCVLCSLLSVVGAAYAQPVEWVSARSGLWADAGNWSTLSVPGLSDEVLLGHLSPYSVLIDGDESVGMLSIVNPLVRADVLGGASLSLGGDVLNNGLIRVNPKGAGVSGVVHVLEDVALTGSGTLRLNAVGQFEVALEVMNGKSLTNGSGHVIEGRGQIMGSLINEGWVVAGEGGSELSFWPNNIQSPGLMTALSQSRLNFRNIVDMGGTGVLEAVGTGSEILVSGRLLNGEIRLLAGGLLRIAGIEPRLVNVTMRGPNVIHVEENEVWVEGGVFEDLELVLRSDVVDDQTMHMREFSSISGTGSIRLESDSIIEPTLEVSDGSTFEGVYAISGYGRLNATFVNRGGIVADVPGRTLSIGSTSAGPVVNETSIVVRDGSRLQIGNLQQVEGSELLCTGNGSVLAPGSIFGGSLVTSDGGIVEVGRFSRFEDMHLQADITVPEDELLNLDGLIVNDGFILGAVGGYAAVTLEGTGRVRLRERLEGNQFSDPIDVLNGVSHTIEGRGVVTADIMNAGLIRADEVEQEMDFRRGSIQNDSIVECVGGARMRISVPVSQGDEGVLRVTGPGSVLYMDHFGLNPPSSFTGGEIRSSVGGYIQMLRDTTFSNLRFDAHAKLDGDSVFGVGAGVLIDGLIEIEDSVANGFLGAVRVQTNEVLQGSGEIRFNDPSGRSSLFAVSGIDRIRIGEGITLSGQGRIFDRVLMRGTFSPGLPVAEFGLLFPFELTQSARVEIDIAPDANDKVVSEALVVLAGTLDVRFIDGFAPDGYWARTVIEALRTNGDFDHVNAPSAPSGLVTRVYDTGTELVVGQTCLPDMNLDGAADFFDVSVFVEYFGSGSLQADLNGDGALDFFDVSAFLVAYQDGCP